MLRSNCLPSSHISHFAHQWKGARIDPGSWESYASVTGGPARYLHQIMTLILRASNMTLQHQALLCIEKRVQGEGEVQHFMGESNPVPSVRVKKNVRPSSTCINSRRKQYWICPIGRQDPVVLLFKELGRSLSQFRFPFRVPEAVVLLSHE